MSDNTFKMKYEITSRYLTKKSKRRSGNPIYPAVKFIVAHDTGNPDSTASGNVNYFENSRNRFSASAHIFVDDKQIIECIPLLTGTPEKAWHVLYNVNTDNRLFGFNANDAAAGVEYCYGKKINADEAYARYVWVMAYICFRFNLDTKTAVAGHYFLDPDRKTDPVTGLANSRRTWEQLLRDVTAEYNECLGHAPEQPPELTIHDGKVRANTRLNIRAEKPDTRHPVKSTVVPGTILSYTGFVTDGQNINGNSKWYRNIDGNFFWSGGVDTISETSSTKTGNWWIDNLNIQQIWNTFNEKGNAAKVAVLDSGYNTTIPDIANGVKDSRICFNSIAGRPITIDDIYGHGSHCASLIGSRNTSNIIGCAPESELYIAKICSEGSVRSFDIFIDAINWAIKQKVDVISISYGGESLNSSMESIINKAVKDHNIMVIASIGDTYDNSLNKPCYPALFKNCLAVGASNRQNEISSVTILSDKTEINAPGEDISAYWKHNNLIGQNGTSQAAAIVSGICALIISSFKKKNKNYSVYEIKELITQYSNAVNGHPDQKVISPLKIFNTI